MNGITDIRPWCSQHATSLPCFNLLLLLLLLPVSGASNDHHKYNLRIKAERGYSEPCSPIIIIILVLR